LQGVGTVCQRGETRPTLKKKTEGTSGERGWRAARTGDKKPGRWKAPKGGKRGAKGQEAKGMGWEARIRSTEKGWGLKKGGGQGNRRNP